jgi:hypothetical protein
MHFINATGMQQLTFELLKSTPLYGGSRDSAVRIVTGYGMDDRVVGVRVPVGSRIFSSPRRPDRPWGQPASYRMVTWGSFPGSKAAGA